jgi:hypothetical protein
LKTAFAGDMEAKMINSQTNESPGTISARGKIPDYSVDLPSLLRQIRLYRSTLGAVLDELECGIESSRAIEEITQCTIEVACAIESLWDVIKQSK